MFELRGFRRTSEYLLFVVYVELIKKIVNDLNFNLNNVEMLINELIEKYKDFDSDELKYFVIYFKNNLNAFFQK